MIVVVDYLCHFRNDVATALYLNPVPNLHTKALDLIHVVQRGIANRRSADRNWS